MIMVSIIAVFVIYFVILLYGNNVQRGVREEKENRIVELILSSVAPERLMAGKVFGPYQITMPGGCNVDNIVSQGEAAMIDKGHDPSQFRQMMFYFPSGLGCDFAGLASSIAALVEKSPCARSRLSTRACRSGSSG